MKTRNLSLILLANFLLHPLHAEKLDVLDLSFLWPVPKNASDVSSLISLADEASDGDLMSDEVFSKLIAKSKTVPLGQSGEDLKIGFKPGVGEDKVHWKIAGIRVNPVSIGVHQMLLDKAGEAPSLRLIVQPVTADGSSAKIHDTAFHVVFDYVKGLEGKKHLPDTIAYQSLVDDLVKLKGELLASGIDTSGKDLDVHPGFLHANFDLTGKLRALLKKHTASARLNVISAMGIPGAFEPWGFFSVTIERGADGVTLMDRAVSGHFGGENPASQVMDFRTPISPKIFPAPQPLADVGTPGFGLGTALLFDPAVNLDAPALPGAPTGHPLAAAKIRDLPDLIANTAQPFFHTGSTDCASCHSETTLRLTKALPPSPFAYKRPAGISGVSKSVQHKDNWNVRDFGWGFNFRDNKGFHPTISQRAANEAADSADFTNRIYLKIP